MKWTWEHFGYCLDDFDDASPEVRLLGSILLRPDMLPEVLQIVAAKDFQEERHRIIFEHCARLYNESGTVRFLHLCERVQGVNDAIGKARAKYVGKILYLGRILQYASSAAKAVDHAKIVREQADRR